MIDNAWAYRHSLKGVCAQLGIRRKFIRPHCPRQNGKVGRPTAYAQRMGLRRVLRQGADRRGGSLRTWLHAYNDHRLYTGVGGHPPITRLSNLPCQYR